MFAHRAASVAFALLAWAMATMATTAHAQPIDPAAALASDGPSVFGAMARGQRHFEDVTGDLPNEPVTAVAVDPRDADTFFVGVDGFVFRSVDGGESWRPVLSFPRGLAIDDSDEDLADATQTGELGEFGAGALPAPIVDDELPDGSEDDTRDESDDERGADRDRAREDADAEDGTQATLDEEELPEGSVTDDFDPTVWARTTAGARAIVFVPGSPDVVYVATPRGLYRSLNRGTTFTRIEVPGGVRANDIRDLALDPANPSRIYLATASGMWWSRDGGASFDQPLSGTAAPVPALCVAVEQLVSTDGGTGVAVLVGTETGLLRSTDGGLTFLSVLLRGLPPFFPVSSVAITKKSETFYAGTSRGLFVGERNAALLERYAGLPEIAVQALSPDPLRPRGVVIGTRTRGVWFSNDAGNTVEEGAEQVPAAEVIAIARPSTSGKTDQIVVATDRGVFRSMPGTGVTVSASALKKLREMWAREPGLEETGRTALEYGRLVNTDLYGMRSRAALSHLLPQLTAGFRYTAGRTERREDFVLRAGDELPPGVDPDNDDIDLFGNVGAFVIEPSIGEQQLFFVTLTWNLDEVIFNPDEVGVGRAVPAWRAAERRVLDRVREAWGARRRLMTEVTLGDAPRGEDAALKHARNLLRLEELTAELDGLTGGAFSNPNGTSVEDSR